MTTESLAAGFLREMGKYNGIVAFLALYALSLFVYATYTETEIVYRVGITYLMYLCFATVIYFQLLFLYYIYRLYRENDPKPFKSLKKEVLETVKDPIISVNFLFTISILVLCLMVFSSIKSTIPKIVYFYSDPIFERMDRYIFFGQYPHEVLQFFLNSDYALIAVNFVYNLWLIIVVLYIFYASLVQDDFLRFRNIYATVIGWIFVGNIVAILLSSVGPCLYGYFYEGHNPYADLMTHLESVNARTGMIWALTAQKGLFAAFHHPEAPISGISAMPSMHVYFAAIIALESRRHGTIAAVLGAAFAASIFVGSIVLGWHYAVDGIVAFVLALAIWRLAGWMAARKVYGKYLPQAYPAQLGQTG